MQSARHCSDARTGPVLSVEETIDYLRSSRSTVYRMVRKGELKPVKLGVRTLFKRAELDALIGASDAS